MPIRKRDDTGAYEVDVRVGGRRVRRSVFSHAEAVELEARLLDEKRVPMAAARDVTLAEVFERYVESHEARSRTNTIKNVKKDSRRIEAFFGGDRLASSIDDRAVDRLIAAERKEGRKESTINQRLVALGAAMKQAVQEARLSTLSFTPRRLRTVQAEPDYLTDAEIETLTDAADERLRPLIWTALLTGCRAGELTQLRWADIVEGGKYLRVTGEAAKGRRERRLPIRPQLRTVLEGWRSACGDPPLRPVDHIFLRNIRARRPWKEPKHMSEELLKVMRGCGIWIPGRGAHVLRRTAAHLLAREGASVVTLQKIMGWSRIATAAAYLAEDKIEQGIALDKLGSRLVRGFDLDEEALKRRDEEWDPTDDLPDA